MLTKNLGYSAGLGEKSFYGSGLGFLTFAVLA
jgi:hypothetical protein